MSKAYSIPNFPGLSGCSSRLLCNPASLEAFRERVDTLLVGSCVEVRPNPFCPPDEAWLTDDSGRLIRLVWGERHSKAMATCGPRGLDANGSPVEAA